MSTKFWNCAVIFLIIVTLLIILKFFATKTIFYGVFYFFLTLFFIYIFVKEKKLAEIFDVSPFYIIGWQSDVPLEGNKKSEVLKLVEEIQAKKDKNFIVMGKGGKGQEVIEMTEEQQALLKALIDSWNKDK